MHEIIAAILRHSNVAVEPSNVLMKGRKAMAKALFSFVDRPFPIYRRRVTEIILADKLTRLVRMKASLQEKRKKLPKEMAERVSQVFSETERRLSQPPILADTTLSLDPQYAPDCEETTRRMIRQMAEALEGF